MKKSVKAIFVELFCIIYHTFPNSHNMIISCSAFATTWHVLCNICWWQNLKRGVQFYKIQFNLHVPRIDIGNRVKQCENLKKKLKGIHTCCFSIIPVKICATHTQKKIFQVVYPLKKPAIIQLTYLVCMLKHIFTSFMYFQKFNYIILFPFIQ